MLRAGLCSGYYGSRHYIVMATSVDLAGRHLALFNQPLNK